MKIVYIHGASATGESFNYIREHLNHKDDIVIEYSSKNGFEENLEQMKKILVDFDNIFFICHSLGGIYALHLANHFKDQVIGAVTLSTPYGGSTSADYAKYFLPFSRLLRDIGPNSRPMMSTNKLKVIHPWTNVVTVNGESPWMVEPNDGVVTIASMKHRNDMEFFEIKSNHYEVVINSTVVNLIKTKIKEVTK
jgi:pimeloyl-ACP methyl ester carboxylesterase